MSDVIENRVVEMQFDNKRFEKNIKETLKSLEDLKKGLDLDKAVSHLENIDKAFNAISFDKIASSVDNLMDRFTLLGTIGQKVIGKVSDMIVGTATNIGKQLTIDPLTTGMSKYEQQVKGLQTITAATGKSVSDVKPYIEELMKYSDETSYSFVDMTTNIGKFVSAGVELEDATKAVQGISNEAARSGAGIQEASRAMYNFAQSLATGSVKLIDWKSIENAGMATQEFKKELIETAKQVGTLSKNEKVNVKGKKKLQVTTENFNSTLASEWLTSEVLIETLKRYADTSTEIGAASFKNAKETKTLTEMFEYLKDSISSGWMQSFEYIIGDYEQATKLWSAIADELGVIFGEASEQRNKLLKMWSKYGGRYFMLDGLQALWEGIKNIFGAIKEGWDSIFPDLKWTDLRVASDAFRDYAKQFKAAFSDETEDGTRRLDDFFAIARGVASVIQMLHKVLAPIGKLLSHIFINLFDPILDSLADFGDYLFELNLAMDQSAFFQTLVSGFMTLADILIAILPGAGAAVIQVFQDIWAWLDGNGVLGDIIYAWYDFTTGLAARLPQLIELFKELGQWINESFASDGKIGQFITETRAKLDPYVKWFEGLAKVFKEALSNFVGMDTSDQEGAANKLKKRFAAFEPVLQYIKDGFDGFIKDFLTRHPKIAAVITRFQTIVVTVQTELQKIKAKFQPLIDWFSRFVTLFKYSLKLFFQLDVSQEQGAFNKLKARFKAFNYLIAFVKGSINQAIQDFLAQHPKIAALVEKFKAVFEKVKNFVSGLKDSILKFDFSGVLEQFKGGATDLGKTFMEKISDLIAWVNQHITIEQITKFAKTAYKLASAIAALRTLWNMGTFLKSFSGVGKSLSETIESFKKGGAESDFTEKFLNLAVGIGIIVAAMYALTKMDPDKVEDAKKTLLQIGGVMAALTIVMSKTTSGKGGSIKDIGVGLLAAAAGIGLLYLVMKQLAKFKEEDAEKSLKILGAIFLEMALFSRIAGKGAGGGFVKLALALTLMLIPIKALASMDVGSLAKGIGVLGILLTMLGVFSKVTKGGSAGGFLGMAAALTLLLVPITLLGNMKTKNLVKGVGAVSILITSMAFAAKQAKGAKAGSLIVFALALGGIMAAFALALKYTKNSNLDQMAGFGVALSAMILSMSVAIKLLGSEKGSWTGGVKAAANLLEFIGVIGLAFVGIGALVDAIGNKDQVMSALDTGIEIFEKLGEGLGKLIGGVVSGLLGSIGDPMDDLVKMGEGLKSYGDAVADLNVQAIKDSISCIVELGLASQTLPRVGGLLNALIGTANVDKFAEDLPKLGSGISAFAASVDGVNANHISKISNATAILGILMNTAIPKEGGLLNAVAAGLFGTSNYEKFSADLVALGGAICGFAEATAGVNSDNITSVSNAAYALAQLNNNLPATGGKLQEWLGTKDLGKFSENLIPLGEGLKSFAASVDGMSTENVTSATNAAMGLAELNNNLPRTGGKLQEWLGKKDLGNFGTTLVPLGEGLKTFADKVSGLNADSVTSATAAASTLAALANNLPRANGTLQEWIGEKNLGDFGGTFEALGTGLAKFSDAVKEISEDKITNTANAAGALATLANAIPADGGWLQDAILGSKNLSEFGGQLGSLGKGLSDFSTNANGVNEAEVTAACSLLTQLSALGVDINTFNQNYDVQTFGIKLEGLGEKLESFSAHVTNVNMPIAQAAVDMIANISRLAKEFDGVNLTNGVTNVSKVFGELANDSEGIGTSAAAVAGEFLGGFGTAFQNGSDPMTLLMKICDDFVGTIVNYIKTTDNQNDFWTIGKYFVEGFSKGISNNVSIAYSAAGTMAGTAKEGAMNKLDEHSPSKVGMEIGRFFTQGFALGIEELTSDVKDASGGIGEEAIKTITTYAELVKAAMEDDTNIAPTIRPVLDLTNVETGARTIDSYFGSRSIGNISAAASQNIANSIRGTAPGDYTEVINSINQHLDNLNESILGMQVVLDSGALVGQIAGQMDYSLGILATYRERGN